MLNCLTFEGLPAELKDRAIYQDLAAKQILVQQGETADSIYFLLSGQIRLATFTEERIINHYFVLAGESFAEVALFSDIHVCSAIANVPSRVAKIDKELFRQALEDYLNLTNVYMNQLAYRYKTVKTLLELRSIRSARERLLQYLILQKEPDNQTIVLQRPLKDLAIELGLSAEALYRNLSLLQTEGVITRKQRSITLNEDW
ncbi:MAG: Crp/Fnr family transcriptional regulator [Pleurocapsa sp. MO_226.B13]|nr:Crp/Fnr family transcriptional regulator [Pleurocapsa sp. MO_226.B13]